MLGFEIRFPTNKGCQSGPHKAQMRATAAPATTGVLMDSRMLAALASSVVSQVLLLLFLLFPTNTNTATINNLSPPSTLFPLLLHLFTSSEIATSISLLSSQSRKRKRTQQPQSPSSSSSSDEIVNSENDPDRSFSSRVPLSHIDSYKACFRMTSSTFQWLSGLLEPLLECRDPVGSPLNLSPEIRLGIGLFRLATGSGYTDISRRFGVSEPTSRFCTKQLCRVLCTNFRFWVAFPNPSELDSVSTAFESIGGFPNCCGVVDCTRFKIIKRGNFQEESIVAQIVVDNSSKILSIVAGFRGDKGDSRVLKSSTLYKDIEGGNLLCSPPISLEGAHVPQYLIGDSGYPLLPWLMVPFIDPVRSSCEEDFNAAHQKMRLPALRTLASLRNWGILNNPIEDDFKAAVACVGACSILHNALLMREDYSALSEEMEDYTLHDQISQYYPDSSSEENSIEKKASIIRSALAVKVREVNDSKQSTC